MNNPVILLGGGGHCRSVIDVAESAGYAIIKLLFIDTNNFPKQADVIQTNVSRSKINYE